MHQLYNYLALGDSYTIGESVPLQKSFPYQVVQLLRKEGYDFAAPEIIAKTGWTTDDLEQAIKENRFLPKYDIITLLIGVNNQYRGRDAVEYKEKYEELLKKALELVNNKKERLLILSIPDYSVTPFARNLNVEKIEKEIEVFNTINKALSIQYKIQYIDVAAGFKEAQGNPSLVAEDGLHPSDLEYTKWAQLVATAVLSLIGKQHTTLKGKN